jgi:hypothetical protein
MSKKLLNAIEIGELIQTLRILFKYHQDLQNRSEVAKFIQRPKIPPFLSESLVVDLGNRGMLGSLECSDFDLSTTNGDVVAISPNGRVKIEVKATAQSAFQLFSNKDIDADFLVWVHFNRYFEDDRNDEIEILTLQEPKRIFNQSRKITLPVFKKEGGEFIVSIHVNLDQYTRNLQE